MKLDILISTMNNEPKKMIDEMNIKTNCVIVNQIGKNSKECWNENNKEVKAINSDTRGLSVSRNIALSNSDADICLLSDDDLLFEDSMEETILSEYAKAENKDYDIIVFEVERCGEKKNYWGVETEVGYLKSMRCASVDITFRRKSLVDNGLKFNEILGAGAKFYMGEENELLFRCLRKGLKIKYVPKRIGFLKESESSWFKGYTKEFFVSRGASFYAMSKSFGGLLAFQFAVRKYSIYKNDMSFVGALKALLLGIKSYKQIQKARG